MHATLTKNGSYCSIEEITLRVGLREPLLIALPGSGCSPVIYEQLVHTRFKVLPINWYAGKGSVAPADTAVRLARVIQHRTGPTVLAGHSTGCAISVITASLAAAHVSALVLSNSGVHSKAHGDAGLPDVIKTKWSTEEQEAFLLSCCEGKPPEAAWAEMCSFIEALPVDRLLEGIEGMRRLDLTVMLKGLLCPVLVAHGISDHRRTRAHAQEMAGLIPNSKLRFVPGGHTPMLDHPESYTAAVGEFLDGLV